jgi:hypothetical protein
VAIDAFAALLASVQGRLGADEPVLTDALAQLRLAFVQVTNAASGPESQSAGPPPSGS